MKQHVLRSALAAATCSALVLGVAPAHATVPTGTAVGFVHTDTGWVPNAPDMSDAAGKACSPKLGADPNRPEFTNLVIGPTTLSLTETAIPSAYVSRGDCGSRAIIGAFRMTDQPAFTVKTFDSTGWEYDYGLELAKYTLQLFVTRNVLKGDEPTFTGAVVVEAGAWWGRPEAGGVMVYYPAGCVQQKWVYTVIAWSNRVEAQPAGPEFPCAQPPLPGTPEIL